jgi:hypothetical protein
MTFELGQALTRMMFLGLSVGLNWQRRDGIGNNPTAPTHIAIESVAEVNEIWPLAF